jgi:hypothetical protein
MVAVTLPVFGEGVHHAAEDTASVACELCI